MVLLLAAILALPIARTSHAADACSPGVARIVSLQGMVEIRSSETEPWAAAALNQRLCADSWIRVGPFSRAALALPNDSVLRLDQQTTVRLRAETEERRSLLDLLLGTLHLFSHRPRALEVDTPVINAATEGTEFLVSVGADQTQVIVFEGRILARNPDGELLLASGDAAVAAAGEAPRPQILAQPRDAAAWTLYYPPILAALAEREPTARGLPPGLQAVVDRVAANHYPAALGALDNVPEGARDARYYVYRAGVLLNVGRVEDARAAIDRALALDPQAGEALAARAIIAIVQDRRDEALADAQRAVELSPDSAAARIALSYAQQAGFQLEAARATLREAVEIAPEDALAWARLAEIELSFGALNAALEAANRAVALAPELSRTQMVLGFADLTRFDVAAAKVAFERAIALDSANPLPRLGLGLALIRQNDLEQGRNEIEIAVALDPDNSLLRSYLGKAFFEENRDQLADEQYAIAKRLDPLDPTPWLYDAIRLQTENRPVEALHNLNRSIALNDNRAVFRSSLLLDEDLATRQVSLARIYDDLGFEQLGLLEASRSLSLNPANSSAHRFLSDVYLGQPRLEVARVSELLQAQLLQPININPIQPSLPLSDLNVTAGAGPPIGAFNEYTPLFDRNRAQLSATGLIGTQDTIGDEVIASGVYDRFSISAGQLHSGTDGFRDNNDIDNDLYDVFGQVAVTPKVNLQAEFRRRETRQGDLALNYDLDDFSPDRTRIDQDTARFGATIMPSTNSTVVTSFFYTDREEKLLSPDGNISERDKGFQAEAQYQFRHQDFDIVSGLGLYQIDVEQKFEEFGLKQTFHRNQDTGYAYADLRPIDDVTLTLGVSYDHFDQDSFDESRFNPKLGVRWNVTEGLDLRLAAFKTIKRALAADQTIEPTQIAGFNQLFDDINGTKTDTYAAGLDATFARDVFGGVEFSKRDLDVPIIFAFTENALLTENQEETKARAYLYWSPHDEWTLSAEFLYEHFKRQKDLLDDRPTRVETTSVPLSVRYFNPLGIFAEMGVTYVWQDVKRLPGSGLDDGSNSFATVGAELGYRFPRKLGLISIEVTNIFDQGFKFQDDNFRTSETRSVGLVPERTVVARLNLTF